MCDILTVFAIIPLPMKGRTMSEKKHVEMEEHKSVVLEELEEAPKNSAIAVTGHPIHAMMIHFPIALVIATLGSDFFYWITADEFFYRSGLWASGFAFFTGVLAGVVGTAELLLVKGIRMRVASWTHAVAAMTLIAVMALNWGIRIEAPDKVLPHGLFVSVLATILTAFAGWHGGKLVFDHGIGLLISPNK